MNGKPRRPPAASPITATPELHALIDIGATSIRMAIAQIGPTGQPAIIDTLQQSVSLGRDTFTSGSISYETVEACVTVLRQFLAVLDEMGMTRRDRIWAVATSAVREAANREQFLDRVLLATGIDVEPIEGTEVNRLTFLAVQPMLEEVPELRKDNLLLVEVGGGNTEILGLGNGQVNFAQTHRLGTFRIRESLDACREPALRLEDLLDTEITGTVRSLRENLLPSCPVRLLILGGEGRFAATRLHPGWDRKSAVRLPLDKLTGLVELVLGQDVDELVRNFHLPFTDAETLGPALLANLRLAQSLAIKEIYVGAQTLRDGMLAEVASRGAWNPEFVKQVLHSAHEIGKKYHYDQRHADQVTEYARQLYLVMAEEHRLPPKFATILAVAAILHDTGTYISNRSHHKHSQYLILNSGVFGLGQEDLTLSAMIARYHRRAVPLSYHEDFMTLSRHNKLAVSKLASILRVVDALDRSHDQHLGKVEFRLKPDRLVIRTPYRGSLAVERVALDSKSEMFKHVYGRKVKLQAVRDWREEDEE